MNDVSTVENCF